MKLLVSHRVRTQVADRGMPTRYCGYRIYSGADQNKYCFLAFSRGIYKV